MSNLAESMKRKQPRERAGDSGRRDAAAPEVAAPGYTQPPSRRGKKALLVHIEPELLRQLKHLAVDEDRSQLSLVTEALDDLLLKHARR